ncbi:MAG: ABC transporter permease [Chloroflexi bacterium]|nr:ABC transporter permease [Chloroflexota bacterium]
MKSLLKMTWVEAKLFLREPFGAFFTLVFPVGLLFLFGSIYGNEPSELLGGRGTIDISVPAYTAMIIATTSLMGLGITMAAYREQGVLRRLQTTPVSPLAILVAVTAVLFGMTLVGMALLVLAGRLVYQMRFEGQLLSVLAGLMLGSLSMLSLGFMLAGVMRTARSAQIVGMVLLYPMLFLSGAGFPRELLPATIQKVSAFLPLTYVVNLLRGLWVGESWGQHTTNVVVLSVLLVAGLAISALTFRWE